MNKPLETNDFIELLQRLSGKSKATPQGESQYVDYVFSVVPKGYDEPCKLTLSLPAATQSIDTELVSADVPDSSTADFERENNAFQKLQPHLLQTHQGRFVAIRDGKVIDDDINELVLAQRLERAHRTDFVLVRKVTVEMRPDVYLETPELAPQ